MMMNKLAGRCEVDRGPVCPDAKSGQARTWRSRSVESRGSSANASGRCVLYS